MKKLIPLLACVMLIAFKSNAQVQIDKQLQLTGTGNDARISGIDSVVLDKDAVNVKSLQSGKFIYGADLGNSNNFVINITPSIASYSAGLVVNFLSNQSITGTATLNVNGLGAKNIYKNLNVPLSSCDITSGQMVSAIYDGTNFQLISPTYLLSPIVANAGPDQLNISGTSAVLAATPPTMGTGAWSIISGSGGSITTPSSPTSAFTGVGGTTYTLAWTISYACGTIADTVSIGFSLPGKRVFITSTSYTGNMGGISGADAACQSRAGAAGLGGTWKAWLSAASTGLYVVNRLSHSSIPYILLNGTQIAADWTGLMAGILSAAPNINEFGSISSAGQVWTNTYQDGTAVNGTGGLDCSNWNSATSGDFSAIGKPSQYTTAGYWTWGDPSGCLSGYGRCYQNCNNSNPIYCVEQ